MNMIPIIGPTTISTGNEEPSGLDAASVHRKQALNILRQKIVLKFIK